MVCISKQCVADVDKGGSGVLLDEEYFEESVFEGWKVSEPRLGVSRKR